MSSSKPARLLGWVLFVIVIIWSLSQTTDKLRRPLGYNRLDSVIVDRETLEVVRRARLRGFRIMYVLKREGDCGGRHREGCKAPSFDTVEARRLTFYR